MATILVIDDEPQIRALLKRLLEKAGHRVVEAAEGQEAVRPVQEGPVHLIITDVIMPEKGGLETMMELRRDFPDINIIIMSGKVQTKSDVFKSMTRQFGVKYVFQKPFDTQELLARVQELVPSD
jgi:two-component system response regulator (stage 0 sporulation protein F)